MPKKLTKNGWRALRVFTSYSIAQAGGAAVYIDYFPDGFNSTRSWNVLPVGPGVGDHYRKVFPVNSRREKAQVAVAAQAWCEEHGLAPSGTTPFWERDPFGGLQAAGHACKGRASGPTA